MAYSKAKPFLKWAGGKTQLLPQLQKYYPIELKHGTITRYVEPFIGGGAVFFDVMQSFKIRDAYISDINPDLILTYRIVQQKPAELIRLLKELQKNYTATEGAERLDFFLTVRTRFNQKPTHGQNLAIERAADLIFLNKTCFNGLFRLNSKGGFNVPFGKYARPTICDEANILACSRVLANVEIQTAAYTACQDYIHDATFAYFDPPYRPLSKTANFTTYTGSEFSDKDQKQLAAFFHALSLETNAKLILSNSDPQNTDPHDDFFERTFESYNIFRVRANRAINSDAAKRGAISEVLITNFEPISQLLELSF